MEDQNYQAPRLWKSHLSFPSINPLELLNLQVEQTENYTTHEIGPGTPKKFVEWADKVDSLILKSLEKITWEWDKLEVVSRQFMFYVGNSQDGYHLDPFYKGDFGEIKPYTILLYLSNFKGGELEYGPHVVPVKRGDLVIFPVPDKIQHKVLPYKGPRIVYQPTFQRVEDNQVVLFARKLYDQIKHGDEQHQAWLKEKIKESVMEWTGRKE